MLHHHHCHHHHHHGCLGGFLGLVFGAVGLIAGLVFMVCMMGSCVACYF